MVCVNPLHLSFTGKNKILYREGILVPCGKCVACKIQRAKNWAIRLLYEFDSWDKAVFLTLTYSDEKLPKNVKGNIATLRKSDLQKFFKRIRIDKKKIKYYACGEYGDLTMRPHYHAIVFGLSPSEKDYISERWGLGHIYVGTVTYESCRYVAQYIDKKYYGDLADEVYTSNGLLIPFQLSSQGMGLEFATNNVGRIVDDMFITNKGVKHSIPRYFRSKLPIPKAKLISIAKELSEQEEIKVLENFGSCSVSAVAEYRRRANQRREAELAGKSEIQRARRSL